MRKERVYTPSHEARKWYKNEIEIDLCLYHLLQSNQSIDILHRGQFFLSVLSMKPFGLESLLCNPFNYIKKSREQMLFPVFWTERGCLYGRILSSVLRVLVKKKRNVVLREFYDTQKGLYSHVLRS